MTAPEKVPPDEFPKVYVISFSPYPETFERINVGVIGHDQELLECRFVRNNPALRFFCGQVCGFYFADETVFRLNRFFDQLEEKLMEDVVGNNLPFREVFFALASCFYKREGILGLHYPDVKKKIDVLKDKSRDERLQIIVQSIWNRHILFCRD